jgi:hypothetical protein
MPAIARAAPSESVTERLNPMRKGVGKSLGFCQIEKRWNVPFR